MARRIFTSVLLTSVVAAQTIIDYSQLPVCAQQCTLLSTAQTGCTPAGGAPVSNQATYQSCFCQSAYLRTLYTTPDGVCNAVCGQSDLVAIQQWYINLCHGGTVAAVPAPTAGSPAPTSTGSSTSDSSSSGSSQDSWWSEHWKWIVMVIVLLIGFSLIIVMGVVLKKRHTRKRNDAANVPPLVWGPHQNQHHTQGFDYPRGGKTSADREKGKSRYVPDNRDMEPVQSEKRGSEGKLKKILGR